MITVGIDIGSYSVKCAAAEIKGKERKLIFVGEEPMESGGFSGGSFTNHEIVFKSLRKVLSNVTLTGSKVVLSIPCCSLLHKATVEYPGTPMKDAMKMIRWDYIQYLPEGSDTSAVTVAFSGHKSHSDPATSCVDVYAIPEYLVANYTNLFADISVSVNAIDLSTLALERFYGMVAPTSGLGIIINVGHEYTEYAIVVDGTPDYQGFLPIGGSHVAQDISETLDIPFNDAVAMTRGSFSRDTEGDVHQMVNEEFFKLAERVVRNLSKVLKERYRRMAVERCILAGGVGSSVAFANRIIDRLDTQALSITSIPGVQMSDRVQPLASQGLGKYAVAVGLSFYL